MQRNYLPSTKLKNFVRTWRSRCWYTHFNVDAYPQSIFSIAVTEVNKHIAGDAVLNQNP